MIFALRVTSRPAEDSCPGLDLPQTGFAFDDLFQMAHSRRGRGLAHQIRMDPRTPAEAVPRKVFVQVLDFIQRVRPARHIDREVTAGRAAPERGVEDIVIEHDHIARLGFGQ